MTLQRHWDCLTCKLYSVHKGQSLSQIILVSVWQSYLSAAWSITNSCQISSMGESIVCRQWRDLMMITLEFGERLFHARGTQWSIRRELSIADMCSMILGIAITILPSIIEWPLSPSYLCCESFNPKHMYSIWNKFENCEILWTGINCCWRHTRLAQWLAKTHSIHT